MLREESDATRVNYHGLRGLGFRGLGIQGPRRRVYNPEVPSTQIMALYRRLCGYIFSMFICISVYIYIYIYGGLWAWGLGYRVLGVGFRCFRASGF